MIRALVALALMAGAARAETRVELPDTAARLVLDDAWHQTATPGTQPIAAYRHDLGLVLAVTRADTPNPDAWIRAKRQAYAAAVEQGVRAAIPGYRRLAMHVVDAAGVPALDLEARRRGGATVVVRVLLFRTYALSLAIEVPSGGDVAVARQLAGTFAPPPRR